MLLPPTPTWGGYTTKNTLTLEKKNGRLWRGTLLTVILILLYSSHVLFFIFRSN